MLRLRKRKLNGWSMTDTVVAILAVFMIAIVFYPLWYVFINSISNADLVNAGKVNTIPLDIDWGAYTMILYDIEFWRSIAVTLFLCVAKSLLILYCTVCVAYPLIRPNLKFRKVVVAILIASMYVDGGLIPSYILMNRLHLYNTVWALILPGCVGAGNIMLLRVYMKSIGSELMDAAFVDGATNIQTLLKVILPLSKPCMAVISLQTVVGTWNSWFNANIYMPGRRWQPVQLYLSRLMDNMTQYDPEDMSFFSSLPLAQQQKMIEDGIAATRINYAAMLMLSLPLIIIYPFIQKDLQQGIMVGSLKE